MQFTETDRVICCAIVGFSYPVCWHDCAAPGGALNGVLRLPVSGLELLEPFKAHN